jgi:hypothetical protein
MDSPTPASATSASNSSLHTAKRVKNDEFYTQMPDIENELKHYKSQFKGKVVFCNCDDPSWSSFWIFFTRKFEEWGLTKLVSTHYEQGTESYKLECVFNGEKLVEHRTELKGDGDFRSLESLAILAEADIVVTNPPFSLFREYVAQLIENDKKFLIIGNSNAITYKETFKLIKGNQLWLGATAPKVFKQPDGSLKVFGNICWFTNLEHKKRNEELTLFRRYADKDGQYSKYDNYDAIEVSKVKDIPCDYTGYMGVPITFLGKHNPSQFEIVALGNSRENFTPTKDYLSPIKVCKDGTRQNGNAINCVLTIRVDTAPAAEVYYEALDGEILIAPYARIIIKQISDGGSSK